MYAGLPRHGSMVSLPNVPIPCQLLCQHVYDLLVYTTGHNRLLLIIAMHGIMPTLQILINYAGPANYESK